MKILVVDDEQLARRYRRGTSVAVGVLGLEDGLLIAVHRRVGRIGEVDVLVGLEGADGPAVLGGREDDDPVLVSHNLSGD